MTEKQALYNSKRYLEKYQTFLLVITGDSDGKASAFNVGDPGLIPGLGRSPGEGNGNPPPVPLLGKSHRQRSLVGYSAWGRKELDTTERLHFHLYSSQTPSVSG